LWGISGIITGIALLLTLNPHWAAAAVIYQILMAVSVFFANTVDWLTHSNLAAALIDSSLGLAALVLAGIIAALLYGLHRGENTPAKSAKA